MGNALVDTEDKNIENVYENILENTKRTVYAKESYLFDYVITCYEKEKQMFEMLHTDYDKSVLKNLLMTAYKEYLYNSANNAFFSLEDKLVLEELERIVFHNYGNEDIKK